MIPARPHQGPAAINGEPERHGVSGEAPTGGGSVRAGRPWAVSTKPKREDPVHARKLQRHPDLSDGVGDPEFPSGLVCRIHAAADDGPKDA
ncbi:hypothetical protein [Sinomonas humi]|uniref:hypothetical protein n=1 Tax=Sinomonas humi TaxID=1338436 RepID=UPI0012DFFD5C|nr:hypothetical protein [Sinomonas humi]